MIVKAFLPVDFVTTYHTVHQDTEQVYASVDRIRSREEYKKLKENVKKNGVLDPVIAMVTPTRRCMVEIGEQRVLVARELGIENLVAVIYTKNQGKISFDYERKLKNIDELKELFKTQNPIGLERIIGYVESDIISF